MMAMKQRAGLGQWAGRITGALCVLVSMAVTMTARALPGPELEPPAAVIASADGAEIRELRVGQANDGRAVVVFVTRTTVNVQRLGADGVAAGPLSTVLSLPDGDLRQLSLSVGGNGHYALAVQSGLESGARVYVRRYGPDGTRIVNVGEPEGPIPGASDDPATCDTSAVIASSAPAVSVDDAGNLAYTFARSAWCSTGPSGALQPNRTALIYRHAPIDAPASDGVVLFRQSPVNSGGFRVLGSVASSIALQPGGTALVTWMGHEQPNELPSPYLRPVSLGLATAAATRIDIGNSFDRSAPLVGARSSGYTLYWRSSFNDPETLTPRERCQTLAVGLDAVAASAPVTVARCSSDTLRRALIVRADGRHEIIVPTATNWLGTRYDSAGAEQGSYGGGTLPNRFLDIAPLAWSPTLASGNYLAAYLQRAADDSLSEIVLTRYAGPDGTPALELSLSPASRITTTDGRPVSLNWRSNRPAGSCFGFGSLSGPLASSGNRFLGVFTTAGERTYGIACGPGALSKSATLSVIDPNAVTATATWTPASSFAGQQASVSWSSENATACSYSLTGEFSESGALSTSGSLPYRFNNAGTQTFTLTCTGSGGGSATTVANLVVAERQPVTVEAAWTPATIFAGQSATVRWSSSNAAFCTSQSTGLVTNGPAEIALAGTETYRAGDVAGSLQFTLTCTSIDGSTASTTATLTVQPVVPTVSASWVSPTIRVGETPFVMWSSSDALACEASLAGLIVSGPFGVNASGMNAVSLPSDQAGIVDFTLTCVGAGGGRASTTARLTVTAITPTVSASWVSPTIRVGETPFVMWSSSDALACEASLAGLVVSGPFGVDASGMNAVSLPGDQAGIVDFTLTCVGPGGGRASTTARLTVNAITPTVSASWTSPTIRVGETPFVTWSSSDALACEASLAGLIVSGPFGVDASGMNAVSLPGDQAGIVDFTLTCVGAGGGRASTTARLTVNAITPTVSASWVSPTIRVGETPFVTWSSSDALACEASLAGLIVSGPFGVDASGMTPVSLPFNTAGLVDFTLSCVGPGGARASTTARLTVNAIIPVVSASWVNPSIRVGETPLLMWSSSDAVVCQGSFAGLIVDGPFAIDASGMTAVPLPSGAVGTLDFTLDCTGPGDGRAVATARLTVNALPPPPPPPPVNLGSITLTDGRTVQLVSSAGAVVNTRVTARPAVLPAGFTAVTDFLAFDITNIPVGGSVEVTLTLPAGVTPNGYVKCTPDCVLFNRAVINGNQVRLALTDGGAGDADGVADGVIRDPGAPGTVPSGGGGAAGGLLPLLGLLLMIRRRTGRAGR